MEQCESCGACMHLCPGQAIPKGRFLLDMERCHGWLDVIGRLPDSAPRTIAACCICQKNCPKNSNWRLDAETVEFTEAETDLLMVVNEMPENPFSISAGDMINLMCGWGYPEALVSKITELGIYSEGYTRQA